MPQRIGGFLQLQINGEVYDARGNFTTNLGEPLREAVMGAEGVPHGYKETPQPPFIEGEITDRGTLNRTDLVRLKDATVTLKHGNEKLFILNDAWYAGEGTMNTEEANMPVRFEGMGAEEVV